MEKGTRVRITAGEGEGVTGSVFWTGKDRYREGMLRLGVRGDDGETYWASQSDVNVCDDPLPAGEHFEKDDRVQFRVRGEQGTGTVFWIGESRNGPGQRLGIRDDANPEDAVWLDARMVKHLDADADPGPAPAPERGTPTPPAPRAEAPPIDDAWIDQMAAQIDEDPDNDVPF